MEKSNTIQETPNKIDLLSAVKAINGMINFDEKVDYDLFRKRFYDICRKYNIKNGIQTEHGKTVSTIEWITCRTMFIQSLVSHIQISDLFDETIPDDLEAYTTEEYEIR